MVGTILPVVYGERARGRGPTAHWIHAAGSVVAAAALGLGLGWLGSLVSPGAATDNPRFAYAVTAIVAGVYVLRELELAAIPAPQLHRQVPSSWRVRLRPRVMAFAYGLGLGLGLLTHIWVSSFYAVIAWVVLVGNGVQGLVTFTAFGIGRAAPVVVLAMQTSDIEAASRITRRLETWSDIIHLTDGLILALASGALMILFFAAP